MSGPRHERLMESWISTSSHSSRCHWESVRHHIAVSTSCLHLGISTLYRIRDKDAGLCDTECTLDVLDRTIIESYQAMMMTVWISKKEVYTND